MQRDDGLLPELGKFRSDRLDLVAGGRCRLMHAVHVYKRIDTAFLDKMPRDSGIPDPATMAEWSPWDASGRRNNRGSRQEFKIEPAVPTVRRIFGRNPRSNSSPLPSPPSSLPPATWNLCTLDWKSTRWLVSAKGSSFISFSFFPFFFEGGILYFSFYPSIRVYPSGG